MCRIFDLCSSDQKMVRFRILIGYRFRVRVRTMPSVESMREFREQTSETN